MYLIAVKQSRFVAPFSVPLGRGRFGLPDGTFVDGDQHRSAADRQGVWHFALVDAFAEHNCTAIQSEMRSCLRATVVLPSLRVQGSHQLLKQVKYMYLS